MYRKKNAYPIVISKEADGFYYVEIPDFNIATQGKILQTLWKWRAMQLG